jgi:hypothetical protein
MKPRMRKTVVLLGMLATSGAATPAGAQPSAAPRASPRGVSCRATSSRDGSTASTSRHEPSRSTTGRSMSCRSPWFPTWSLLQAGVPVMMRYNVDAGRNLVTYLAVRL